MVGHMALPAITGSTVPASLSPAVIGGLLCESLGYDGIAVTDCLEMGAVAAREGGVPLAAVDALRTGADIAMICHHIDRQCGALEATYGVTVARPLGLKPGIFTRCQYVSVSALFLVHASCPASFPILVYINTS